MALDVSRGGSTVLITGAASALGRRVVALVAADADVERVLALDQRPLADVPARVETHVVALEQADLKRLAHDVTVIVHLAQATGAVAASPGVAGDGALARLVLEAASAVGAEHVVLLSSATAYGAWANNPVPLTEEAPLRPNPGLWSAFEKAEVERAAGEWRDDHPGVTVSLLRPTVTVCAQGNGWLARALARSSVLPVVENEPPAQFLDVADLASAVDLARRARLNGPLNVAPDGWIDGDTLRALAGGGFRLRAPERLAVRWAGLCWRWGLGATPPELLPFTAHPWVVANDRLKAEGWVPMSSNEEAYVAAHEPGRWAALSATRRREVALAAGGVVLLAKAMGIAAMVRRRRRRR